MDRAEAIKIIEKMDIYCNAVETARDMAIAALREQEQSNATQRNSNASNALTNADRIRAMTDEELAHWICKRLPSCSVESCPGAELCNGTDGPSNGLLKWLQQPCGGADHA